MPASTAHTPKKRVRDREVAMTASAANKLQKLADVTTKGDAERMVAKLINAAYKQQLDELQAQKSAAAEATTDTLAGGQPISPAKPGRKRRASNGTAKPAKGRPPKGAPVGVNKPRRATRRSSK